MFLYRNSYYKGGYISMTDKHMNKYIYKTIKTDTLKKIINFIHRKLYSSEKYTQYNMMIKCGVRNSKVRNAHLSPTQIY
jgi:hypothetical protein